MTTTTATKTVCPRHEIAHSIKQGCPYCEIAPLRPRVQDDPVVVDDGLAPLDLPFPENLYDMCEQTVNSYDGNGWYTWACDDSLVEHG